MAVMNPDGIVFVEAQFQVDVFTVNVPAVYVMLEPE